MYPQRELIRLAAHKATLRRDIALRRAQCAAATAQVVQPLVWLDRLLDLWRRIAPLALAASVPLIVVGGRRASPRLKILGWLVRWGPLVFGVLRGLGRRNLPARPPDGGKEKGRSIPVCSPD